MSVSPSVSPNCKVNVVWTKVLNYIDLNIYYGDLQFEGKNKLQCCLMSMFCVFSGAVV